MKQILISDWMPNTQLGGEHCCMKILYGTDPNVIANRVAFIEKTPRVRIAPYTGASGEELLEKDFLNWKEGPKGAGGNFEEDGKTIYGYYPPSREWCDAELAKLGYVTKRG